MIRRVLLAVLLMACASTAFARGFYFNYVQKGANTVTTGSFVSSSRVQLSYPSSTVNVYLAGTTTLATLFSDSGGTAKANPFTAGTDGSFSFWTDATSFDITFNGTGITTSCGTGFPGYPCISAFTWANQSVATSAASSQVNVSLLATGGAGTSGNPWTGWETAVNALAINTNIYFPGGYYTQTSIINMKQGWYIHGDGKNISIITGAMAGTAFRDAFTANVGGNIARITIIDLQISTTNVANNGSGILDAGGALLRIIGNTISGFRSSITLIQTENAVIEGNDFQSALLMNMWIVNGADYKPANGWDIDLSAYSSSGLANQIWIDGNQFNPISATYCVVDDGGNSHIFDGNNFEGATNTFRITSAAANVIENNFIEASTNTAILTASTGLYSGGGSSVELSVSRNYIQPIAGQAAMSLIGGGNFVINANEFNTNTTPIISTASAARVFGIGNVQAGSSTLMFNTQATSHFQADDLQGVLMKFAKGIWLGSIAQASLPVAPAAGTEAFCSDCKNSVDNAVVVGAVCVAAGNGALAVYINGSWRCY